MSGSPIDPDRWSPSDLLFELDVPPRPRLEARARLALGALSALAAAALWLLLVESRPSCFIAFSFGAPAGLGVAWALWVWPREGAARPWLRRFAALLALPVVAVSGPLACLSLWAGRDVLADEVRAARAEPPRRMLVLTTRATDASGALRRYLDGRRAAGLEVDLLTFESAARGEDFSARDASWIGWSELARRALAMHRALARAVTEWRSREAGPAYLLVVAGHAELPPLAWVTASGWSSCDLPLLEPSWLSGSIEPRFEGWLNRRAGVPALVVRRTVIRGDGPGLTAPTERWLGDAPPIIAGRIPFGAGDRPKLLRQALLSSMRYADAGGAEAPIVLAATPFAIPGDASLIQALTARSVVRRGGRGLLVSDRWPGDHPAENGGLLEVWGREAPSFVYTLSHGNATRLSGLIEARGALEAPAPRRPAVLSSSGCATGRAGGPLVRALFSTGHIAAFVGFTGEVVPQPPLAAINSEANNGVVGTLGLPLGLGVRAAARAYAREAEASPFQLLSEAVLTRSPRLLGALERRFGAATVARFRATDTESVVAGNLSTLVLYGDPSLAMPDRASQASSSKR